MHTDHKPIPPTPTFGDPNDSVTTARGYCSTEDRTASFDIEIGIRGGTVTTSVWTNREGVENLRDICNTLLAVTDNDN